MDDLISRAAAIRALASSNGDYLDAWERIEKITAVDAIPVEWMEEMKHWAAVDGDNECVLVIAYLLDRWQNEQEARY